jgi:putative nucleotidyltransferase with HDIG domain
MLIPGLLAGLVFYLVNHLLLCLIRAYVEHRRVWEIWREDYRWLWPHYMAAGLLGMTLGVTYEVLGWVVTIVMASPVALMHLAITQFIKRTTGYVNELRGLNRQLSESYESTLQALSRALDTRDAETEEHSQRVSRYTELIGRRFGLPEEEVAHLRRGAMLHDIGKIGVPDAILLKPAKLTADEIEAMRKHPTIGYTMIAHIPFLAKAAEIVLHHHESYDGNGYPSRLADDEIPLGARIFAVVDTLDAMTSDRPYRTARTFEEALAEIEHERGKQFDPAIVDVLLAVTIPELIRCRNGVIVEAEPDQSLQPKPSLSAAPA